MPISSKKTLVSAIAATTVMLGTPALAQIEEIIITAEMRDTNVQETPLAVTAVSSEMMESRNQTNLVQISAQAPNVSLTQGGSNNGPSMLAFIRGVGQTDFNYAVEPGVGIYVDDVYFPTLTGTLMDLLDLDRVEILRGPQGTLSGRNSIGGSIKLFSRKPDTGAGARIGATLGSYDRTDLSGASDFTLIDDKLYARIAGISRSEDGYVDRLDYGCTHPGSGVPSFLAGGDLQGCKLGTLGGRNVTALRGQLRWYATDDLEVNVAYDRTNEDSEPAASVLLGVYEDTQTTNGYGAGTFLNSTIDGSPIYYGNQFVPYGPNRGDPVINDPYVNYATFMDPNAPTATRPYSPVSVPPISLLNQWGTSISVDWDLSDTLSLKSITAYREYEATWAQDVDGSPMHSQHLLQHLEHRMASQELRLSGIAFNDFMDYTIGAFLFDQDGTLEGNVNLYYAQLNFIHGADPTPSDTKALFANTTFHLTDDMNLTAGLRYSEDHKDYTFFRSNPDGTLPEPCTVAGPPSDIGNPPNCALAGLYDVGDTFEDDRVDWRVALDYQFSDNMMVYAQTSTGYKAGGINPRPYFEVQIETVQPEEILSYEIGFKSNLWDNRLQLNGAYFFNEYTDIQLQQTACELPGGGFGGPCLQPGNAGDADVQGIELEAMLVLDNGFSLDASISTFDFEYTRISPNVAVTEDMITPFSPELKYSVGAQYEYLMGNGSSLTGRMDVSYQDDIYANPTNAPSNLIDSYSLVNGRVTWRPGNGDWTASFEVNNLTDEVYYLNVYDQYNPGSSGSAEATIAKPRTYAVSVQHNF